MVLLMGLVLAILVGFKILGPIWMVGALILAACHFFMGQFFKAALYVCLFLFLYNLALADPPKDLIPVYLMYLGLGIALEAIKWYVLTIRRKRSETEQSDELTLRQNRKGVWEVR